MTGIALIAGRALSPVAACLMFGACLSLCAFAPLRAFAQPSSGPGIATQPAKPGKANNRAAPVEPASSEAPREGLEPPVPVQEGLKPTPGAAAPAFPQTFVPTAPRPAQPGPVFLNPAVQGIGKNAPSTAVALPSPAASNEPDWRKSQSPADPAFGAFQRGLYVTALREALKIVADDPNNGPAMTLIGEIYRDGLAVKQDHEQAMRWYRLADARGDRQASFALARVFVEGAGVKPDIVKAREYFERAAARDHAGALYNLGIMAIDGDIQDFRKAADFFRRGMERGDLDSAYSLAFLYRNGQGVDKDEARATALLRQAADQHHLAAMIDYAISLFNGRGVDPDETGAATYLIRAAWRNAPVAQNRLARMYVAGRGVKADIVEAMKWHVLAKANGLKDEWLDGKLNQLTPAQRDIVEEAVRKFAVK